MERLQKAIAQTGYCSRRKAEELILQKKVMVNGKICDTLGTKVRGDDVIEINGQRLKREDKVYYILNKPRGCVSTTSDEKNRKTVLDYLPKGQRLYPVGRLDYDTSGALILTNDGSFTNHVLHPRYHVPKTYLVKVSGIPDEEALRQIRHGFRSGHMKFAPAAVRIREKDYAKKRAVLELTVYEGQNHLVKNMMDSLGYPVLKLHRLKFGHLHVEDLRPGEYRKLKPVEIRALLRLSSGDRP